MRTSFGPVAAHYDLLMSHVPYDLWVDYYELLLAQLGQRPVKVLDVCCGTGIVAELLDQKGYQVTGFDISEQMILEARRKSAQTHNNVRYHVADAAELDLNESFEGAYSFFDSLNYIIEPDRLALAIRQTAKHLELGASFVFDVNTAYAFEKNMFDQSEDSPSSEIRYHWVGDYNAKTRLITVDMQFERDGVQFNEVHVQRAYETDQLVDFLEEAGFGQIRIFDSYTLNPPRKKSDRLHFVAVRTS